MARTASSSKTGSRTRGASVQVGQTSAEKSTLTVLGSVDSFFKANGLIPDKFIRVSKRNELTGTGGNPTLRFSVKKDWEFAGEKYPMMNTAGQRAVYGIVLSQNATDYLKKLTDDGIVHNFELMQEDRETLRVAHRIDRETEEDLGLIIITNSSGGFEETDGY
jgi:hypothetical protein